MAMPNPAAGSERTPATQSEQILGDVDLQLALLRAQRASSTGNRTTVRLCGLLLLLGLLGAGMAAMMYLQTVAFEQRPARPAPALTGRAP
jgi:hypothetical protein